jgi:hypothetical protein
MASLKLRQNRGGKNASNAASIQRLDPKCSILRPRLWTAALRDRAARARFSGFGVGRRESDMVQGSIRDAGGRPSIRRCGPIPRRKYSQSIAHGMMVVAIRISGDHPSPAGS